MSAQARNMHTSFEGQISKYAGGCLALTAAAGGIGKFVLLRLCVKS